jgi:hypothetical protein
LRGPRDYAAVRQVLAGAGYHGATIVALAPTDIQPIRSLSLVGTDQLRRVGMNVDLQEMTLGTEIRQVAESGGARQGRLERILYLDGQIATQYQPIRQSLDTRGRARRLPRLAEEPAHRSPARCVSRRRQPRRAAPDMSRTANAAVAGCALHPGAASLLECGSREIDMVVTGRSVRPRPSRRAQRHSWS